MKAAVYFGPQDVRVQTVPDPILREPGSVIVKVQATSICGSDLHLYRGTMDGIMEKGHSRLGHELCGQVIEVGRDVQTLVPGDRVSMAYSASCGQCWMCLHGMTAHCLTTQKAVYGFGKAFGDLNGTQAEYMEIPYADAHTVKIAPSLSDEMALLLSCNMPSALIAATLLDIQPGDTVGIVGLGPTGMMALALARSRTDAAIMAFDPLGYRREWASSHFQAAALSGNPGDREVVMEETQHRGLDKVIEAVGTPQSLELSLSIVRPGGTVAAMGVFTDAAWPLNLADVFLRDISLHMHGFANVYPFMEEAQLILSQHTVDLTGLFTHEFSLDDTSEAYEIFSGKQDHVMKVVIRP